MKSLSRLLMVTSAFAMACPAPAPASVSTVAPPPPIARPDVKDELQAKDVTPEATAETTFAPRPASEEISEELRALVENSELVAANAKKKKAKKKTKSSSKSKKNGGESSSAEEASSATDAASARGSGNGGGGGDKSLSRARQLAKEGKFHEASRLLFQLSRNPQHAADASQIRYVLGVMLYEMKLYQTAAFVFYDVVKLESRGGARGKYLRQALEKLSLSADALDSDVLLKYAIKKVDENEFPAAHRDMLYFRTGEIKLAEKEFQEAAKLFSRVKAGSPFFAKSKYKQALALTEAGDLAGAQNAFEDLATMSESGGVTDVNRVSALLGKARILYQKQNFDAAIDAYRDIPRDTEQWHEALFESTWANLRSARFRSALSNFHSLHSDYYEDVYQPESLLLRAIVYLFICRYDEMEKVLGLFEKVYKPVLKDVKDMLKSNSDPNTYFKEIAKVNSNFNAIRSKKQSRASQIPFVVARNILKEGDVRRSFNYLERLDEEKKRINSMPAGWAQSTVGRYAKQVVEKRIESTQEFTGKQIKRHMGNIGRELVDLFEQNGFLRFEVIRGKKESVKKEIAGKGLNKTKIDEDSSRDYYVQNGFEYWPFRGEYWLDEIGNYHYVGVQACE